MFSPSLPWLPTRGNTLFWNWYSFITRCIYFSCPNYNGSHSPDIASQPNYLIVEDKILGVILIHHLFSSCGMKVGSYTGKRQECTSLPKSTFSEIGHGGSSLFENMEITSNQGSLPQDVKHLLTCYCSSNIFNWFCSPSRLHFKPASWSQSHCYILGQTIAIILLLFFIIKIFKHKESRENSRIHSHIPVTQPQ